MWRPTNKAVSKLPNKQGELYYITAVRVSECGIENVEQEKEDIERKEVGLRLCCDIISSVMYSPTAASIL